MHCRDQHSLTSVLVHLVVCFSNSPSTFTVAAYSLHLLEEGLLTHSMPVKLHPDPLTRALLVVCLLPLCIALSEGDFVATARRGQFHQASAKSGSQANYLIDSLDLSDPVLTALLTTHRPGRSGMIFWGVILLVLDGISW